AKVQMERFWMVVRGMPLRWCRLTTGKNFPGSHCGIYHRPHLLDSHSIRTNHSSLIKLQVRKGGLPPLKVGYLNVECGCVLSGGKPPFPTCNLANALNSR